MTMVARQWSRIEIEVTGPEAGNPYLEIDAVPRIRNAIRTAQIADRGSKRSVK